MRIGLKILLVAAMTLAILIPLLMIGGIVEGRQAYRTQAVDTVSASYAGPQALLGPVLKVPYTQTVEVVETDDKGVAKKVMRERDGVWTFFPETLDVVGNLIPTTRQLGLYDVRVYQLEATAKAAFRAAIPKDEPGAPPRRIGVPSLIYGVSDVRGFQGAPRLQVGGRDVALQQGAGREASGVHAELAAPAAGETLSVESDFKFVLAGTESLAIAPLAARNRVVLDSVWPHPQFNGQFLPLDRDKRIDDSGFHAVWEVSSLATTAQAQYLRGGRVASASDRTDAAAGGGADHGDGLTVAPDVDVNAVIIDRIGVSLVDPVNAYSKADRATKYGILFVVLTFVGFFMFELIKQLRIHPIQYALVGLALSIFFLLLVSLSEHVSFGWAYLVASVACIGLLAVYVSAVLHSTVRGLSFATMLATLYAALYGLLLSEDNALVLGAGLLFVILAAIMTVTRRVDWYSLGAVRPGRTDQHGTPPPLPSM